MSKQLKFKFKKTLKNAEFVHADLEYHEELFTEAKSLFKEEIDRLLKELSPEDQKRLADLLNQKLIQEAQERAAADDVEDPSIPNMDQIRDEMSTDIVESDVNPEGAPDVIDDVEKSKLTELKKLFYKIAELTHPDKVATRGLAAVESQRLERVFKKALQAYEDKNWYILYSIASNLGIDIVLDNEDYLNWIEEDIRTTLASISQIGSTVAWLWYIGNGITKKVALGNYFKQIYDFVHPHL